MNNFKIPYDIIDKTCLILKPICRMWKHKKASVMSGCFVKLNLVQILR